MIRGTGEEAVLGNHGIDILVVRLAWKLGDDLLRKANADRGAVGASFREKAVVESAAAPQPLSARGEGEAGHEEEIDVTGLDDRRGGELVGFEPPVGPAQECRIVEADQFHLVSAHPRKTESRRVFVFPQRRDLRFAREREKCANRFRSDPGRVPPDRAADRVGCGLPLFPARRGGAKLGHEARAQFGFGHRRI